MLWQTNFNCPSTAMCCSFCCNHNIIMKSMYKLLVNKFSRQRCIALPACAPRSCLNKSTRESVDIHCVLVMFICNTVFANTQWVRQDSCLGYYCSSSNNLSMWLFSLQTYACTGVTTFTSNDEVVPFLHTFTATMYLTITEVRGAGGRDEGAD